MTSISLVAFQETLENGIVGLREHFKRRQQNAVSGVGTAEEYFRKFAREKTCGGRFSLATASTAKSTLVVKGIVPLWGIALAARPISANHGLRAQ